MIEIQPGGDQGLPFESGLAKSLLIGAGLGFLVVFGLVTALLLAVGFELVTAAMAGVFVGAFAGVGFGGMTGASVHQPPGSRGHA